MSSVKENLLNRSAGPANPDSSSLRRRVEALDWVHQIDLGNGVVTPGRWPPHPLIRTALSRIDFAGKKVLDVGTWDGLWAFEAERRGAIQVVATDYITQRSYSAQPTFQLAHQTLGSRVAYHPKISVFEIEKLAERDFDIVLFCGVYYHLRDPLRAFAKLRRVIKDGGLIVVEGDAIFGTTESYARFYYDEWHHNDPSNWWVPSVRCLRSWIESSFFDITEEFDFPSNKSPLAAIKRGAKRLLGRDATYVSRSVMVARAVSRADHNYTFPDDDLRDYDRNEYRNA